MRVLILTACGDDPYIFALLQARAGGCAPKTVSGNELVQAARTVYQVQLAPGPEIATRVVRQTATGKPATAADQVKPLTPRELDVLRLAAKGLTNWGISHRTIQGHLSNIYGKPGVNSRTEAMPGAFWRGWVGCLRPGKRVEDTGPFCGYYTSYVHTLEIDGMLSIHGTTGQVWYHIWHGRFIGCSGRNNQEILQCPNKRSLYPCAG